MYIELDMSSCQCSQLFLLLICNFLHSLPAIHLLNYSILVWAYGAFRIANPNFNGKQLLSTRLQCSWEVPIAVIITDSINLHIFLGLKVIHPPNFVRLFHTCVIHLVTFLYPHIFCWDPVKWFLKKFHTLKRTFFALSFFGIWKIMSCIHNYSIIQNNFHTS